jgi:uncharacterized pyridoxamine 5'-phosphate oxidase family protein
MNSSKVSVTLDDFPMVEVERKVIRVKEIVVNRKMIEIKPLLNQLCSYY